MSTPATRSIVAALRKPEKPPLELIVATGTAGTTATYASVVIQGVTVKVPRLAGSTAPAVGGPAYVLASGDFYLYLGTVA